MAPEVITAEQQNTSYDCKADIWSLGITAIEMAECSPPMFDMHPMRVLFMIPKSPPPTFKQPMKWSPVMNDFLVKCMQKDPDLRPNAAELLKHPFVQPNSRATGIIMELIDRSRAIKRSRSAHGQVDPTRFDVDEEEEDDDDEKEEEPTAASPTGQYQTIQKGTSNPVTAAQPAANAAAVNPSSATIKKAPPPQSVVSPATIAGAKPASPSIPVLLTAAVPVSTEPASPKSPLSKSSNALEAENRLSPSKKPQHYSGQRLQLETPGKQTGSQDLNRSFQQLSVAGDQPPATLGVAAAVGGAITRPTTARSIINSQPTGKVLLLR